jgi:hypothetical protein
MMANPAISTQVDKHADYFGNWATMILNQLNTPSAKCNASHVASSIEKTDSHPR